MAEPGGSTTGDVRERLTRDPYRFDFFRAVRELQKASPEKPRIGYAENPSEDVVRFGQIPFLEFPPSAIRSFDTLQEPPSMMVNLFGLLGPQGALPLSYTEYAYQRLNHFWNASGGQSSKGPRSSGAYTLGSMDLQDTPRLIRSLKSGSTPFVRHLVSLFPYKFQSTLRDLPTSNFLAGAQHEALLNALNEVLNGTRLYHPQAIQGLSLSPEVQEGFANVRKGQDMRPLNRALLESGLSGFILPHKYKVSRDGTLTAFLNLFNHRFTTYFFRAWSDSQKSVDLDRADQSGHRQRYHRMIGSTFGLGQEPLRDRDALPDSARVYYAGWLGSSGKSAVGLRSILGDYFNVPAEVQSFQGRWLPLPGTSICRLGDAPETGTLGANAFLGERVWDTQNAFRVTFGPLPWEDYIRFLPATCMPEFAQAWLKSFLEKQPDHLLVRWLDREDSPQAAPPTSKRTFESVPEPDTSNAPGKDASAAGTSGKKSIRDWLSLWPQKDKEQEASVPEPTPAPRASTTKAKASSASRSTKGMPSDRGSRAERLYRLWTQEFAVTLHDAPREVWIDWVHDHMGPVVARQFERASAALGALPRLKCLVQSHVGLQFFWDLNVILKKDEVPGTRLGSAGRLGWTTWLGDQPRQTHADDLTLDCSWNGETPA